MSRMKWIAWSTAGLIAAALPALALATPSRHPSAVTGAAAIAASSTGGATALTSGTAHGSAHAPSSHKGTAGRHATPHKPHKPHKSNKSNHKLKASRARVAPRAHPARSTRLPVAAH